MTVRRRLRTSSLPPDVATKIEEIETKTALVEDAVMDLSGRIDALIADIDSGKVDGIPIEAIEGTSVGFHVEDLKRETERPPPVYPILDPTIPVTKE